MKKILIDAGHYSGYNPSPHDCDYNEGDRMYDLAEYIKGTLEAWYLCKVDMTHERECDLHVVTRGKMSKGYDLFLSLHSNAVPKGVTYEINRATIFRPIDGRNSSEHWANRLGVRLCNIMPTTRSVTLVRHYDDKNDPREYYGVLRGAQSVGTPLYFLVENGFHTNPEQTEWLLSNDNLYLLAVTYVKWIAMMLNLKELSTYFDIPEASAIDYLRLKRKIINKQYYDRPWLVDYNRDGYINPSDSDAYKRWLLSK